MKVYVTLYEHRHGHYMAVYATHELANGARQAVAADQWECEMPDDKPRPSDPQELADEYFEYMADRYGRTEFFSIEELEVVA